MRSKGFPYTLKYVCRYTGLRPFPQEDGGKRQRAALTRRQKAIKVELRHLRWGVDNREV